MRDFTASLGLRQPGRRTDDWAMVALGLFGIFFLAANITGPARAVVVFAATLLVPGWATVRQFAIREPAARWSLIVVTSIALNVVISLGMVWTGFWHPVGAAILVLIASVVSTVFVAPALLARADPVPAAT